ncbi:hypothetical protein GCM10027050_06990 [Psychrosphaera aestuarii]
MDNELQNNKWSRILPMLKHLINSKESAKAINHSLCTNIDRQAKVLLGKQSLRA